MPPTAPGELFPGGTPATPDAPGELLDGGSPAAPAAAGDLFGGGSSGGVSQMVISGDATITVGGTPFPLAGAYPETGTLVNGKPTYSSSGTWPEDPAGVGTVGAAFDEIQGWRILVYNDFSVGQFADHDDIGDPPDLATPDLVEDWSTASPTSGTFTVTLESALAAAAELFPGGTPATPAAPGTIIT